MMRKDVKLGFAIGGVLLAVLVVYMMAGSGSDKNPGGAGIVTEDRPSAGAGNTTDGLASRESASRDAIPDNSGSKGAANDTSASTNGANPGAAGATAENRDPNKDLWDGALNDGKLEGTPLMVTETPSRDGGSAPNANELPGGPRATNEVTPANPATSNEPPVASDGSIPVRANPVGDNSAGVTDSPTTRPSEIGRASLPTSIDPSSPSAAGTPQGLTRGTTHVIAKNETLMKIAQFTYGDTRYYTAIKRANPNIDERKLRPGMTIILPPISEVRPDGSSAASGPVNSSVSGATNSTGGAMPASASTLDSPIDARTEYRIASGDTLERIALKLYGKREMIDRIYETNREAIGPDKNRLKLNMVLKLPEPPPETAAR